MKHIMIYVALLFTFGASTIMAGGGKPECVRKIALDNFGSVVARFGDLNGDGETDVIFAQATDQNITCITALDLDGNRLWQRGNANMKHRMTYSDLAVQIYDWDNDGVNEVLAVEGKVLRILGGATGAIEQEKAVPANDCLTIANFAGDQWASSIVLKDRYRNVWVYDNKLHLLWTRELSTGHYPLPIDIDGDGCDELLLGYSLLDVNGRAQWRIQWPGGPHNNAIGVGDIDGDGSPEFAIACSQNGIMIDSNGTILWRTRKLKHAGRVAIGSFLPGSPAKQIVFVDIVVPHDPAGGLVYCFDAAGQELWRMGSQGSIVLVSTMRGWTGRAGENFILLYRRIGGSPILLDGNGKIVAELPFAPTADTKLSIIPREQRAIVQHFDAFGDVREEIFVYNLDALWVFQNAASTPDGNFDIKPEPKPNPRIYNASFYGGWQ